MDKTKLKGLVLIALLGIILILVANLSTGSSSFGEVIKQKPEVECEVTVDSGTLGFGDPKIVSSICTKTGEMCSFTLSVAPFSILGDNVKIIYDAGDVKAQENVAVKSFGQNTLSSQKLCTNSNKVIIKVINENGVNIASKEVTIN